MPVILTTTPLVGAKQSRDSSSALGPRRILAVLLLFVFPATSRALAVPQEKEKTALGSLTSVGEVYVNDSPAAAEITIFSGDRVRVGENGSATFNMSGKGSLKLSPRIQALFAGKYEYTVELEAVGVVVKFHTRPKGLYAGLWNQATVPSAKRAVHFVFSLRAPDGAF